MFWYVCFFVFFFNLDTLLTIPYSHPAKYYTTMSLLVLVYTLFSLFSFFIIIYLFIIKIIECTDIT